MNSLDPHFAEIIRQVVRCSMKATKLTQAHDEMTAVLKKPPMPILHFESCHSHEKELEKELSNLSLYDPDEKDKDDGDGITDLELKKIQYKIESKLETIENVFNDVKTCTEGIVAQGKLLVINSQYKYRLVSKSATHYMIIPESFNQENPTYILDDSIWTQEIKIHIQKYNNNNNNSKSLPQLMLKPCNEDILFHIELYGFQPPRGLYLAERTGLEFNYNPILLHTFQSTDLKASLYGGKFTLLFHHPKKSNCVIPKTLIINNS